MRISDCGFRIYEEARKPRKEWGIPDLPFTHSPSLPFRFFSLLSTVFCLLYVLLPATAQQVPSETWMGTYLGQSKIGYARFSIDKSNFQNKPGFRIESTSVTRLIMLGDEIDQNVDTTIYLNTKFAPVYETFKMSSGGYTTVIYAKFSAKEIVAEVQSGGSKSTKKIPIPPGSILVGDDTFFSSTMKLKVGDHLKLKSFNPLTLSLDDIQTDVLRREELKLGDETHDAYVVRSSTPLGEITCWQDESGNLLKVTAILGITMIRESKEMALSLDTTSGSYTPPSDLAVITSAATTTEIPKPRQVTYMKVRLSGLADKTLVISDKRQKAVLSEGEKPVAEYEIKADEFDQAEAVPFPIKDVEMQKYLIESPYVQPVDPEISAASKEIVGNEKNAYTAVSRIRAWVHANMQSKGNIGIVRSSVDVLHAKTGVCRDYAVLYAALARSAGIPTKLVAGLVFWKGGFYYHAWAESFVGEWIPIDPTLPTDFVDATHIKLTEGEATAMFDMAKAMGNLKAEIVEFK